MLKLRLGVGGKRCGCKGVFQKWLSRLPSSDERRKSRQIARTKIWRFVFVGFMNVSLSSHHIKYNCPFALALFVEQLYFESISYCSHTDQLGIFIICSRTPNPIHCNNKLRTIAHPPRAPITMASKIPLPSHVSAKYAPIPTATSFVLAASLCSIHNGFSPKGGTSRTSSFFAPLSPSPSSSSSPLGSGMASAGTEKEQATGRWSLEAIKGSAVYPCTSTFIAPVAAAADAFSFLELGNQGGTSR